MTTTAAQKTAARTHNTPIALGLMKGATAAHELSRIASAKGIEIYSLNAGCEGYIYNMSESMNEEMLAAGWDGSTVLAYRIKKYTSVETTRRLQSGRKVWRAGWYGAAEGCSYERGQRNEFFLIGDVACSTIVRRRDVERAAERKRAQRALRSA